MEKRWKCIVCGYVHEGEEPPVKCPLCGAPGSKFILQAELSGGLEALLKEAFAGESKAHVRNMAFAKRADSDGLLQIAHLFRAVAEAEKIHAGEYLRYLEGVIGDTEENLETAFEKEIKANTEIYPAFIMKANEAGREDVAASLARARDVEERHAKLYKEALASMISDREVEYRVCGVCGYVFNEDPPANCPVCEAGMENFRKIN